MQIRSFDDLRLPLAWRRVRTWAQSRLMDIPDRLPYEVVDRLFGDDGPRLEPEHNLHQAILVISSKKSATIRPFVRAHPLDLVVYQALVDRLAPTIEASLPPRDRVGAYRQTLDMSSDHAFEPRPRNDEFKTGISNAIEQTGAGYVLECDISGYFLAISPERLRLELREISDRPAVVADLADLLTEWQSLGVRGLPQGLRPSSPLANFYLASLDRVLGDLDIPFYRWVDDMWALCDSFSEARQVQDRIERHLYELGLTLNGEKTRVLRADTALARLEPAKERFERKKEAGVDAALGATDDVPYFDEIELPDPDDVEREVVLQEHDRLTDNLAETDLPREFHSDMAQVLRELEAIEDPAAVDDIPAILRRAPDLTEVAIRYVVGVAKKNQTGATGVFSQLLASERGARDHEKLIACQGTLSLPKSEALSDPLGTLALGDQHPLIRAKALVAWGKHSKPTDFSVVDRFLASSEPRWRVYAFISMQAKRKPARANRFERWGGGGGALKRLSNTLNAGQIKWTKL